MSAWHLVAEKLLYLRRSWLACRGLNTLISDDAPCRHHYSQNHPAVDSKVILLRKQPGIVPCYTRRWPSSSTWFDMTHWTDSPEPDQRAACNHAALLEAWTATPIEEGPSWMTVHEADCPSTKGRDVAVLPEPQLLPSIRIRPSIRDSYLDGSVRPESPW